MAYIGVIMKIFTLGKETHLNKGKSPLDDLIINYSSPTNSALVTE